MTLAAPKRVRGYNPKSKLGFLRDEFRALKQYLPGGVVLFLTHLHFREPLLETQHLKREL